MRSFNYSEIASRKWDSEILGLIAAIYKEAGKQELYLKQSPQMLEKLVEIAKVQSTEASNAIEGIVTTNTRIKQLVSDKTAPRNSDEKEIIGYRDVMNAAWGTMQDRGNVILNLDEGHKTVKNIKQRGAFTVSIADAAHVAEADYLGIASGNDTPDKFAKTGLTAVKSENVDAPVITEFPLCLECEFIEYQTNEYGCGVVGKVVNVTADESVMNGDKVDISLVNAIAFDPYTHGYYKVTERVGNAFKDGLKLK